MARVGSGWAVLLAIVGMACGGDTGQSPAQEGGGAPGSGSGGFVPMAGGAAGSEASGAGGTVASAGRESEDPGGSAAVGSSGTAGAISSGAAGAAGAIRGTYCPGFARPPSAGAECASDADCGMSGYSSPRCAFEPVIYPCPGTMPQNHCPPEGCGEGYVCVSDACFTRSCATACPAFPCAETDECIDQQCQAKPCDAPGAAPCPSDQVCARPGDTGADSRGCVPRSCEDGYDCPLTMDCSGGAVHAHGCLPRPCASAADCECGFCVNGTCAPTPMFCFEDMRPR